MIMRASLRLSLWCALITALQCTAAVGQGAPPPVPFRILVLGDSVMWGQGLKDQNKFSYKIRDWICARRHGVERCDSTDDVQVHVEAHSGAVIARPQSASELKEENRFIRTQSPTEFAREVNHGYPTMWGQIELAKRYYQKNGVAPTAVNLILVNGGINDMGATKILLPAVGGNIATYTERYCRKEMELLLGRLAVEFPNARIVVPGYFPLVSTQTPWTILWDTIGYLFLNKKEVPSAHDSLNEASGVELAAAPISKKQHALLELLATRSSKWVELSNAAFTQAVSRFNTFHPILKPGLPAGPASQRAFFVPVAFAGDNTYAAGNTCLWRLVRKPSATTFDCAGHDPLKNLIVNDEIQSQRPCMCDQAGKGSSISCLRAAAFHPNKEGAEKYFSAIKAQLEPALNSAGW